MNSSVVEIKNPWDCTGEQALKRHAPEVAASFAMLTRLCPEPLATETLVTVEFQAFLVQFRADVSQIDEQLLQGLSDVAGDNLLAATQVIWIADVAPRMRAALDAIFRQTDWPMGRTIELPDIWPSVDEFLRTIARLDRLGPVMTELIRLRGASLHQCRVCSLRRSSDAIDQGADESMFATVDDYANSDLPAAAKAALALTDAIIRTPYDISPKIIDDVHRLLTPAQAVEVVGDVVRNAANKIAVALRADAPEIEDGLQLFTTRANGAVVTLSTAVAG